MLLALLVASGLSGSHRQIRIESQSMGRRLRVTVVAPDAHDTSEQRFPVVCLLHGYGSNGRAWLKLAPLRTLADRYGLLFVAPTGAPASWWLDSPVHDDSRYATFVVREMLPEIDRRYRTVTGRTGRALIGSSMGGHGALTLAARYPDLFAAAVSISGILDLRAFPDRWEITAVLGPVASHAERWQAHSFVGLIDSLPPFHPQFILDCGTDDFALPGNRAAHALLEAAGVEHVYLERPGYHTMRYVDMHLEEHIERVARILNQSDPEP